MSLDAALKMAVTSCKSFDETASWRTEDDVINITNSARNAGDFLSNQHLAENCNSNNNNKDFITLDSNTRSTEENLKICEVTNTSSVQLEKDHLKTDKTEVLNESTANLNSFKNTSARSVEDNLTNKTFKDLKEKKMKLIEAPLNCQEKMENNRNLNLSPELTSEINKIKESSSKVEIADTTLVSLSAPQQLSETRAGLNTPTLDQSNGEEDNHSMIAEEEKVKDPDWVEERFRVDRRKLEQMLQGIVNFLLIDFLLKTAKFKFFDHR